MQIALAQLNQQVGDLAGNARAILTAAADAARAGARLVVTPELSLCGYPPEDLLLRPAFIAACARELETLATALETAAPRATVLVGFPEDAGRGRCHNALAVLAGGRVASVYRKQRLPNYTVFDEERYFEPGDRGLRHRRRRRSPAASSSARTCGSTGPRRRRRRPARSA